MQKNSKLIFFVFFFTNCRGAEITKLQNLKGETVFKEFKNGRTDKCVASSTDLNCDSSAPCRYGGSQDASKWFVMEGDPDYDLWTQSVGTPINSESPTLAVQLGGDVPFGVLTSDPMSCAKSGSRVIFKFWANQNVQLTVCLVSVATGNDLFCAESPFSRNQPSYPGPIFVDIPQSINEPFTIRFMASSEPGVEGLLLLDDIYFYADLCDDSNKNNYCQGHVVPTTGSTKAILTTPVAKQTTPTIPTVRTTKPPVIVTTKSPVVVTTAPPAKQGPNVCQVVPCNFEANWCNFNQAIVNGTVSFQRRNSPYGSPVYRLFDVRTDPTIGYFVSALINGTKKDVGVLGSPEFEPSRNRQLLFKYYRAAVGLTVKVCFDTTSYKFVNFRDMLSCGDVIPPLSGQNALIWNQASVRIPDVAKRFYLVAAHDGSSGSIGSIAPIAIDNISIGGC